MKNDFRHLAQFILADLTWLKLGNFAVFKLSILPIECLFDMKFLARNFANWLSAAVDEKRN